MYISCLTKENRQPRFRFYNVVQVSRSCVLTIFVFQPSLENYLNVAKTYKVPYDRDNDIAKDCKAHLRWDDLYRHNISLNLLYAQKDKYWCWCIKMSFSFEGWTFWNIFKSNGLLNFYKAIVGTGYVRCVAKCLVVKT